jgi:stearoyl-CoA desaturase (delta-9 desaturase)
VAHDHAHAHDDIVYPATIPFILVHIAALGVFWTGFPAYAVWMCVILYVVRMFAITGGFHRYFSHRSFKTSRVGQFLLAFLAQTSAQKGVLWWAAIHRHHHLHSDTEHDVHSPRHHGMLYSHVGWIFSKKNFDPDYGTIRDLAQYPELRWLDKYDLVPPVLLGIACFVFGGWPGLFVGFFLSTVLTYHGTFLINSLAHGLGNQRYLTGDDSRNHWLLALITMGEGWHNNHHHYQSATRQGFKWWEVDITYYILKALSWTGLVWDLREPPEAIVKGHRPVGRKVVEKVARDLAATVSLDHVTARVREKWSESHTLEDLAERATRARDQVEERLAEMSLPHLPTVPELRDRAEEMFMESPSLDDIVHRAHEMLAQAVAARLLEQAGARP